MFQCPDNYYGQCVGFPGKINSPSVTAEREAPERRQTWSYEQDGLGRGSRKLHYNSSIRFRHVMNNHFVPELADQKTTSSPLPARSDRIEGLQRLLELSFNFKHIFTVQTMSL
jgi:hypothetical protein